MEKTILLVDDNSRSLKLLEAIFLAEGYTTITAVDGQEAMQLLLSRPLVDLIITDILMPNVDGYYLCYKIRNHRSLRNIPIIIYSATYTSLSDEKLATEMGADLFLQKPSPASVLASSVQKLLSNPIERTNFEFHSIASFEVMHQYSSDLVNKLEQRNIALEEIRQNLEQTVAERINEIQTVNEELLASNEELKTANEELYAINDKLTEATILLQQQSNIILKQKDEQLNRVLESTDHIIWSLDLTGNGMDYMSNSIHRITNETSDQFLEHKESWINFIYPPDRKIWEDAIELLDQTGHSEATCRFVDWKGKIIWMEIKYWIIKNEKGEPIRQDGVATDITKIKEAEKGIQKERLLLRSIIDNIPDFIFVKDAQLRHIINNKARVALLGGSTEKETLGKSTLDYFGDAGLDLMDDDRIILKTGKSRVNKEEVLRNSTGEMVEVLTTKVPLKDDDGKIIGIIGISRDITEYKKQERVLSQYRENLDILFNNTLEQILLLDLDGKIILLNKALLNFMSKATGRVPEVGSYLWDITVIERKEIAQQLFKKVISGEAITLEVPIYFQGEEPVILEVRYEPVFVDHKVKFVTVISIDITERNKSKTQLQESRLLLTKAYEVAKIGYWSYNPETNASEWSDQAKQIIGLDPEASATFEGYLNIIHLEDLEMVREAVTKTITEGKSYNIEHRIVRPSDGTIRWLNERADFISSDKNQKLLVGIIQDITDRKLVEEALVEFNHRYELISKATNDAIWDWNIEEDRETWNHGIHSIFGYEDGSINSSEIWWKEKIHPDDYDRIQLEVNEAFARSQTNWTSQYRYLCADGTYKHVLDRAYIIYKNNKPVRMIGAMQDVTEQKEYEKSITAIAQELSELIENANTPIFGTDRNGYVNEWNRVTAELTGYSKNEALTKKLTYFISERHHKGFSFILDQIAGDSPVSNLQIPIVTKDHRDLIILLNATPRKNSSQQITGMLMVGQNITELIEYRQNLEAKVQERTHELHVALKKEKELVEMKSKFVSIASHEFRTPLSTIALATGFIQKYHQKMKPEDMNVKLKNIEKQVNHMAYLLDDVLLIGKAEAGRIKIKLGEMEIKTLEMLAREVMTTTAKKNKLHVSIEGMQQTIITDEKLMRNIIINLITNAVKFSPGKTPIEMRIKSDTKTLTISVKDSGIGIPKPDLNNLFSSFYRGSNVGTIEGTGLGLSIVKKACDLLDGEIKVHSRINKGTEFIVSLPCISKF
jgi:PAS domain S-box-containing protein